MSNSDRESLDCPSCGSSDTYEDHTHALHCFDCGEIDDAYMIRYAEGSDG